MKAIQKITLHVPEELLKRAQKSTGQGITETVRQGLRLVAARDAYRKLRDLRAKVKVDVDVGTLREDRR